LKTPPFFELRGSLLENRIWKNVAKRAIFSVRIFFLCLAVSVAALAAFFYDAFSLFSLPFTFSYCSGSTLAKYAYTSFSTWLNNGPFTTVIFTPNPP